MPKSDEFRSEATVYYVTEIEARLPEAHLTSSNAMSFASQGLYGRAVETLLNVDTLIYETKALLETLTILRRARPI